MATWLVIGNQSLALALIPCRRTDKAAILGVCGSLPRCGAVPAGVRCDCPRREVRGSGVLVCQWPIESKGNLAAVGYWLCTSSSLFFECSKIKNWKNAETGMRTRYLKV